MPEKVLSLTLLPVDFEAAIAAYTTGGKGVSYCCPVFQCLKRAGLNPERVGHDTASLHDGSVLLLLPPADSITSLDVREWQVPRLVTFTATRRPY